MDRKLELETRMAWKEAGGRGVRAWEGASGGDKGCGLRRDVFSPSIIKKPTKVSKVLSQFKSPSFGK